MRSIFIIFTVLQVTRALAAENTLEMKVTDRWPSRWQLEMSTWSPELKTIGVGYRMNDRILLSLKHGSMERKSSINGGDLKDWNYVERDFKANTKATFAMVSYFFADSKHVSAVLDAGLIQTEMQMEYSYNRYKPYNGAICVFSPCEKAVEESDGGSDNSKELLGTAGIGVLWPETYFKYFYVKLSAYYTTPSQATGKEFGNKRRGRVDPMTIDPLSAGLTIGAFLY